MGCIVDFLLAGCDANAANVCACVRAWLKVFLPHGHLCSVSYVRGTKGTEGNQMEFLLWGGAGSQTCPWSQAFARTQKGSQSLDATRLVQKFRQRSETEETKKRPER